MIFIDPDNGFEPKKSSTDKHIKYDDIRLLIETMAEDVVISAFQHSRRIKFTEDFAQIAERLGHPHISAIYWQDLMFVIITKNIAKLEEVINSNREYSLIRPVKLI